MKNIRNYDKFPLKGLDIGYNDTLKRTIRKDTELAESFYNTRF